MAVWLGQSWNMRAGEGGSGLGRAHRSQAGEAYQGTTTAAGSTDSLVLD